jgi:two-component system, cell cycle response regulator
MSIKQKILLRISLLVLLSTAIIIVIVSINFRSYSLDSALDKAQIISELVKNGLTAQMMNKTIDNRETFLTNIAHLKDIEEMWVVRGEAVTKEYGKGLRNEELRDVIDEKVLSSGEMFSQLIETRNSAVLRVSIPFKAISQNGVNCLSCHNVKEGTVLGGVSMELDVMPIRQEAIHTILNILFTIALSLVVIIFLTDRLLGGYLNLFESLKKSLHQATQGKFTQKIDTNFKDEAGDMITQYDHLLDKLDSTFGRIDKELRLFVAKKQGSEYNTLDDAEYIINAISKLYQFKKAIDHDVGKKAIYERLAYVYKEEFGLKNFTFFEVDDTAKHMENVWQEGNLLFCSQDIYKDCNLCRAKRSGNCVVSKDFPYLCPQFTEEGRDYICIPINIGGIIGLVINIVAESDEDMCNLKEQIEFIRSYANEASPVLESKRLLKMIKDSALKDGLTGLYNRKFLDEYVETLAPQVKRQKNEVGILMIDMDHFKMVNDTYGHDVGDTVLKELSHTLESNVRDSDLVIRYGGEEFIVILNDVANEQSVLDVAEKLRQKVEERTISVGVGKTITKTISVGASLFPDDSESIWQVIKFSDVALYDAKQNGRNRVTRFNSSMWDDPEF